jgi:hypothetical protein
MHHYAQFNIKEKEKNEDVNIPFQMFVPPGESSFEVQVPRHYDIVNHGSGQIPSRRMFHLSQLCMTPAYYSQKAAQLDLDSKGELDVPVQFDLRTTIKILPNFDQDVRWEHEGGEINKTIKKFNSYFETTAKPNGLKTAMCFIDWIDSRWPLPEEEEEEDDVDFETLIQENLTEYYGDFGVADAVQNALEESARTISNVNNYLFPIKAITDETVLGNIRLRLHIAPNTSVHFSSAVLLRLFGFDFEQIGNRGKNQRFYFHNPNMDEYICITAEQSPQSATLLKSTDKVGVTHMSKIWASRTIDKALPLRDFRKNDVLKTQIKEMIKDIARENNIDIGFDYNAETKKFSFSFPSNPNIIIVHIVPKELASRLGFGSGVTKIDKNSIAEAITGLSNVESAETLAKTLVYDTGVVLATHDRLGSMSTMGMSEYFMGCLWPRADGTIELKRTADAPPAIFLPTSGTAFANVHFNLWVFNDDGSTRKLEWKTGVYLAGILQGKVGIN